MGMDKYQNGYMFSDQRDAHLDRFLAVLSTKKISLAKIALRRPLSQLSCRKFLKPDLMTQRAVPPAMQKGSTGRLAPMVWVSWAYLKAWAPDRVLGVCQECPS